MIFFSLCDFFAKDHPFVSFIALKIIYFFHFFFFFFSFLIFKSDSFIVGSFLDFYNGYEAQYQQSVRVCQWPRTGWWRFYQVVSSDADVWLLGLSVPCVMFLFSFHEFQGGKKLVFTVQSCSQPGIQLLQINSQTSVEPQCL